MNYNVKMLYGCPVPIPRDEKDNIVVGVSESNPNGNYISKIRVDNANNIDTILDNLNKYFNENPHIRDWVKSSIALSLFEDLTVYDNVCPGEIMDLCKKKTEDIFKIIFGGGE